MPRQDGPSPRSIVSLSPAVPVLSLLCSFSLFHPASTFVTPLAPTTSCCCPPSDHSIQERDGFPLESLLLLIIHDTPFNNRPLRDSPRTRSALPLPPDRGLRRLTRSKAIQRLITICRVLATKKRSKEPLRRKTISLTNTSALNKATDVI